METVFITGANRGIGLALTRKFAEAGFKVFAACRAPETAEALSELAARHAVEPVKLDVGSGEDIMRISQDLSGQAIDILVNNAGIIGATSRAVADTDYDLWTDAFAINAIAPFQLSMALIPNLRLADRPRIVTISSQMGAMSRNQPGAVAYRSSKAAVNKAMQVLELEYKEAGIIICPVHPGWVQTDMGGANAEITGEESATGLFRLITGLTPEDSGKFYTWEGKEHDW